MKSKKVDNKRVLKKPVETTPQQLIDEQEERRKEDKFRDFQREYESEISGNPDWGSN